MRQAVLESTPLDKTFPINVFFCNHDEQPIHIHWHAHIEWIYVVTGRARLQIDANFSEIHSEDLVFVNANQIHGVTSLEKGTALIAIVSNESLIRNFHLDSTESKYIVPIINRDIIFPNIVKGEEATEIRALINDLIREFTLKNVGYELIVKSKIFHILGLMFRNYYKLVEQNPKILNRGPVPEEFRILLKYLESNYVRGICIKDAAAMINISPSHFYRLFKKITGKTLIEYINNLRIYGAETLLVNSDLSISEIAERVGFGSATYFGKVFRESKFISPAKYRKMAHDNSKINR
ncbi:helix-turn-helix transcriptional regulator [Paenibacillus abyssi]|uniref:AraC family transcriptional regulator n=1 Tax=Paenibacillus abyssi TaxID=1340531 RepID=A0A917FXG5_9BACL|nr:AraC family transcriptional regulator [Paenibacillus abyssi]GGG11264.1 AraC family transcriptional regulator [Paenibacillus abyssi]